MKSRTIFTSLVLLGFLFGMTTSGSQALYLPPLSPGAALLGNAFSYQGYLTVNGQPAEGAYDLKFSLWVDSGGSSQVGGDIFADDQPVSNGYFTVLLDFGANFQGDKRWLKIEVRPGAETGAYTPIAGLQELTATPYALYAKAAPWAGLSGVPSGFADGVDNNSQYAPGTGLLISGSEPDYVLSVDNTLVQVRVVGSCPTGQAMRVINSNGSVQCQDTDYTQGTGIQIAARQINVDTVSIQARVVGICPIGEAMRVINANGTVTCQKTDYTAGPGMTIDPSRQISLNSSYWQRRVTGTCAPGSSIASIDSMGLVTCETDDDHLYTAGWGLNLTTGAFSVVSSVVQQRVSGSCRPGSAVQSISQTGLVTCWDDAPLNRPVPPSFNSQLTSPAVMPGNTNQVTIGADGLPFILVSDLSDNNYKILHCAEMYCSTIIHTNIDTFVTGSNYASMALDPAGRLQIAYYKGGSIWHARCNDIACTAVTTRQLVTIPATTGPENDILIAHDGFALVAFYTLAPLAPGVLMAAHCGDIDCILPASFSVVDAGPLSKPDPAMTLGADGHALIAYQFDNIAVQDIKVAYCMDDPCSTSLLTQVITAQPDGFQPSITTGADALGLVVYWDQDYHALITIHCADVFCSTIVGPTSIHSLDPGNMNPQPMVTIGAGGYGVITFFDLLGAALAPTQFVAHCNDLLCSTVSETTWLAGNSPPAITISPSGNPLLTAPDLTGLLRISLCGDPFCANYFRRR